MKLLLLVLFTGLIFGMVEFLLNSEMSFFQALTAFFLGTGTLWLGFTFSSSVSE
ncbi:hypothetical protein PT447_00070 [Aliarcobacter butzleri]|uniref:hypothetical protein n=1 Tax=Aliarcobacter butzleri TaxID=28197 RepID=UPI0024DEF22E|nr:hypothetical protein [Aliarcobacter butzleri]MDK2063314.1 hypothetical protein [Aliarcobacter butzleri]